MDDNLGAVESAEWVGPEFIHYAKSTMWYVILAGGAIAVSVLAYVITGGSLFAAIAVIAAGLAMAVFASRAPKDHNYLVDYSGIHVGDRTYAYDQFEYFSIVEEAGAEVVYMTSNDRLQAPLSIYVPEDKMDSALAILEQVVPYQERSLTMVEQLMHRLRF